MKNLWIYLIIVICLCACSGSGNTDPFQPLSKITEVPEHAEEFDRAVAVQSGNSEAVEPVGIPTDEAPFGITDDTFVEAKAPADAQIPPTAVPATAVPTATPAPTATPLPADPVLYAKNEDGSTTYEMQQGDSFTCLARRFNINLTQLMKLNGVTSDAEAKPGMIVRLPSNGQPWSALDGKLRLIQHPAIYTTYTGDTLFSIACKFGDVRPEDLAKQNDMRLGIVFRGGEQVMIP